MSGAINLKKMDEKSTFKRTKVMPKRRASRFFALPNELFYWLVLQESESSRLRLDTSDTGNSSGNELLSPTAISLGSPPFSCSFETREQPQVNKGPTLYVRGFDLVADSLQKAFEKHGNITRLFVEERQKSAFITFGSTEEAEAALKDMDGYMLNGITLHVSFARRQNQNNRPIRGNSGTRGDRGGARGRGGFSRGNTRGRGGDIVQWEHRRFDSSGEGERNQRDGRSGFRSVDGDHRKSRNQRPSRSPSADRRSSRSPSEERRGSRSPSQDRRSSRSHSGDEKSLGDDKASRVQPTLSSGRGIDRPSRGRGNIHGNEKRPPSQKHSSPSASADRRSSHSPSQERRSSRSPSGDEKQSQSKHSVSSPSGDDKAVRGRHSFRSSRGGGRPSRGRDCLRGNDKRPWQKGSSGSTSQEWFPLRSPSQDRRSSRSPSADRRSSRSPSGDEQNPQGQRPSRLCSRDDNVRGGRGRHGFRPRGGARVSRGRGGFRGNDRGPWQKRRSRSPSADRRSSRSPSQERRSSRSPSQDRRSSRSPSEDDAAPKPKRISRSFRAADKSGSHSTMGSGRIPRGDSHSSRETRSPPAQLTAPAALVAWSQAGMLF
ncbi:unnamed protein product [Toxocara canis]|uniref:Negative elongation factor E n=1 Tax=Toxocara canis TaxID=6265 RepID=A0A183V355_TOXCA|nr:unnamed protein product [Toxocara canis]